ncbi:TPA: fucose isomerase [bacterium]|nr:fucose isomerase [bacterium]
MKGTVGLIVGSRGFFPAELIKEGRERILKVLEEEGFNVITFSPSDGKFGAVETLEHSINCAELFKANSEKIEGIIVTLPNFGDERSIANTLRFSKLDVPVLVHAFPDDLNKMDVAHRRDSFCGKLSICNNLNQYGIPFSLTKLHTVAPESKSFREDLKWFNSVCKVVNGLKNARIGLIGARPAAFNTVRFSEKLLENYGISVEPIDLSEIFDGISKLPDNDSAVREKVERLRNYMDTAGVPENAILKMAKFSVVIDKWMKENKLVASAIQCWSAIENIYGIVPCAVMSMMSESLLPSACETDVPGVIAMYALQLASGTPSVIVDWNNNYGEDPDKAVVFHCSNYPKSFLKEPKMTFQDIISGTVGKENAYGSCAGRISSGPMTFARVSTNDLIGTIQAYVGEGEFTDDPLSTFGGYGIAHVEGLQELLRIICERGFEHHVAMNKSNSAEVLYEAFSNYLGWDVYWHK